MCNRYAHVHCIKFIIDTVNTLKNVFFFLFSYDEHLHLLPRNVVNEERQLAIHPPNFLSACTLIEELLLDTCLMPLYMNNIYMNQMYLLVISEPCSTHMTVQIYMHIFFLFQYAQFQYYNILKMNFHDRKSVLPLSNCQVFMEWRAIVPCVLNALVDNSIRVLTARSDCLSHWHWWGFF